MKTIFRIRCPVCGYMHSQKWYENSYSFELQAQTFGRIGKRGISKAWKPKLVGAFEIFRTRMISRLRYIADMLELESEKEHIGGKTVWIKTERNLIFPRTLRMSESTIRTRNVLIPSKPGGRKTEGYVLARSVSV